MNIPLHTELGRVLVILGSINIAPLRGEENRVATNGIISDFRICGDFKRDVAGNRLGNNFRKDHAVREVSGLSWVGELGMLWRGSAFVSERIRCSNVSFALAHSHIKKEY